MKTFTWMGVIRGFVLGAEGYSNRVSLLAVA